MIKFPPLKISKRDREFRLYSRVQRAAVVRAYLFKGYSNRQLDGEILGLDCDETNGYQSMGILHHYGLTESYKGFLKDIAPADVLSLIPDECSFDFLYDILEDESDAEVLPEEVVSDSQIGTDKTVLCKIRQNQDFFRERVLKAYGGACCITGISKPSMLRASHIKPWCKSDSKEKVDVHNGLCLNALHDCAFDCGAITVDASTYKVRLSSFIEDQMDEETYNDYFRRYDGKEIVVSQEEDGPGQGYLAYHNKNIFEKENDRIKVVYEMTTDQTI